MKRITTKQRSDWSVLSKTMIATGILLAAGATSANSLLGLVTSPDGSLQISSDNTTVGGDNAGGANATLIAPNIQICDERVAKVARFDVSGTLQVCKAAGGTDANGQPLWEWQTHQVVDHNIANDAVAQQHIRTNAVGDDQIRNSSIRGSKLMENAVTSRELANNAVNTTHLVNGAVTTDKLANGAVTTAKLANGAVTTEKILNGAVTGSKIATGAVNMGKLSGDVISAINRAGQSGGGGGSCGEGASCSYTTKYYTNNVTVVSDSGGATPPPTDPNESTIDIEEILAAVTDRCTVGETTETTGDGGGYNCMATGGTLATPDGKGNWLYKGQTVSYVHHTGYGSTGNRTSNSHPYIPHKIAPICVTGVENGSYYTANNNGGPADTAWKNRKVYANFEQYEKPHLIPANGGGEPSKGVYSCATSGGTLATPDGKGNWLYKGQTVSYVHHTGYGSTGNRTSNSHPYIPHKIAPICVTGVENGSYYSANNNGGPADTAWKNRKVYANFEHFEKPHLIPANGGGEPLITTGGGSGTTSTSTLSCN